MPWQNIVETHALRLIYNYKNNGLVLMKYYTQVIIEDDI